jgi:hypothetical protein
MNMKIKATVFMLMLVFAASVVFTNCGGKKEEAASNDHPASVEDKIPSAGAPQFSVDPAFQKQLAGVFTSYVILKDAFVASDAARVKSEADNVLQAIGKADMNLLTGVAHKDWMTYLSAMEGALKQIQSVDGIEAQRTSFKDLSEHLYKSIRAYGLGGTTAYYEYCPMAFNDTGAYWLSDNSKIRNPYFGDKMLTCGTVEETLN